MTTFLNQTQPVMHLSPRVHFDCAWLFAILSRLFSVLQNVLPRSYYFCSLPGGPKLLYTAGRSLHGCVCPFCGEASLKCIFLSISRCTIVFTIKNIIHVNVRGKSQRKMFKHRSRKSLETLHCYLLILACLRFTRRVWACEGLAPPCPRAAWFLRASPTPFHFAGDGEGKAVVFQLNFWG